ncbi:DUF6114 domain-containing protein [Microbacterium protaetiae]|uniref:DUF6114 domain-containing protein n=1 Tax=Microbacterium protaetiae TaxID=2509458 RepID=UPI001F5CACA2|nr:DUF6114 domain-containing protein [Microbacterium protaetiae]
MLLIRTPQRRRDAAAPSVWSRFGAWRRRRPFIGGALVALAGIEMFFSGQLDMGHIHVQLGIEGFQATVIPIALVLLGLLAIAMPAHHVFYGVLALVVAVYSLIGVNLGGFVLGMLLGCIGGVLVVAWMPRAARAADDERAAHEADSATTGTAA